MIIGGTRSRTSTPDGASRRENAVAIVFWEGYLGVAPSLINATRRLVDLGFAVDVITRARQDDFAPPPDLGPHVRVMSASATGRALPRELEFVVSRLTFLMFALRVSLRRRYSLVIGVDMNGLVTALPLSWWKRCPLVHWSLEINPLPAGGGLSRLSRWLRLKAYQAADVAVAQDAHRTDSLVTQCGIRRDTIVRIANAPMGSAFRESSSWIQERLGLASSQKVAVHIGMLSDTVMSRQLASEASRWSDEWLLVFHERQRRDMSDPYLQQIQAAGGARVALSLEPVPYNQLDRLVASARVGILLYDPSIGLTYSMPGSSGKLGQYLKCGVPVVALDLPGLPEVIDRFECGICVSSLDEVGPAIERIDRDLGRYRENAWKCYEEFFEFSKQFDGLIETLRPELLGYASGR